MDNRITKRKLKNHWHYSWWKYIAVVIVCALGVDMLFAMTAYRPPADKKIQLYMCNGYAEATAIYEQLWPAFSEAAPDQELLSVINIDLSGDDMYTNMQFTTYIGAQEGDVVMLPVSSVKSLAQDGGDYAFLDLSPYLESGALDVGDIDLSAGMMASGEGEIGLYAIPSDSLYGLLNVNCVPEDSMLCVMGYSMNPDNAVKVINLMFDLYQTEKPEGYDDLLKTRKEAASATTQLFR